MDAIHRAPASHGLRAKSVSPEAKLAPRLRPVASKTANKARRSVLKEKATRGRGAEGALRVSFGGRSAGGR
jgi:hypothetical protein